jgi:phage shock protein C
MNTFREDLRRNGLARPRNGRVLGGVCSGLGRRFGIDPWPARLLFIIALMILPGSQLLIYPALWFLMPLDSVDAPVPYEGYGTPQAPTA